MALEITDSMLTRSEISLDVLLENEQTRSIKPGSFSDGWSASDRWSTNRFDSIDGRNNFDDVRGNGKITTLIKSGVDTLRTVKVGHRRAVLEALKEMETDGGKAQRAQVEQAIETVASQVGGDILRSAEDMQNAGGKLKNNQRRSKIQPLK